VHSVGPTASQGVHKVAGRSGEHDAGVGQVVATQPQRFVLMERDRPFASRSGWGGLQRQTFHPSRIHGVCRRR